MRPHFRTLLGLFALVAVAHCKRPPPTRSRPAPSASASSTHAATAHSAQTVTDAAVARGGHDHLPEPEPPDVPNGPPPPADVAAPPPDAEKLPSGLAFKVLKKGTSKQHPVVNDRVRIHYTIWTRDGHVVDSSIARAQSQVYQVSQAHLVRGLFEGLLGMAVGETRRLWIPSGLAYGNFPAGGAPKGDLTYDVQLLEVIPQPPEPDVPADLKTPPPSAKQLPSGLVYRVLKSGVGATSPQANDRVKVHYTGWTQAGKRFDSSIMQGEPALVSLSDSIKGWQEGIQLMKVGDKMRFWIPADLAYGNAPQHPGEPAGPVVFDIELISIYPSH